MKRLLVLALSIIGSIFLVTHVSQAANPYFELVKDVNPGKSGSNIYDMSAGSGRLFFSATDDINGRQIWTSDGTTAGTLKMTSFDEKKYDIKFSSSYLTVNNIYFFHVLRYSDSEYELWRSDGTVSGTFKLIDLPDYLDPRFKSAGAGGLYYFVPWSDPNYGRELWVSDGSISGTKMLKDINPGTGSSSPHNLTQVNNTLFFLSGNDLWKSDGTESGTMLVANFEESSTKDMRSITNVNGIIYLGYLNNGDYELWKHDSVSGQTVIVKNFDGLSSNADSYAAVGDMLYFSAKGSGADSFGLWKSDGSPGGTMLVKDFGSNISDAIDQLTNVNGILFFKAKDAADNYGSELWKSDGTSTGTLMVKDITVGSYGSTFSQFTAVGDTLFFINKKTNYVKDQWISDGTEEGTINMDMGVDNLKSPASFNGQLYLYANDRTTDAYGTELYRYTPSGNLPDATSVVTIKSDLSFTLSEAIYNSLTGDILLWAAFEFFGEQNGKLLWELQDYGVLPSTKDPITIAADLSFTISSATYQSLTGDINLDAQFIFLDNQNGKLLWELESFSIK